MDPLMSDAGLCGFAARVSRDAEAKANQAVVQQQKAYTTEPTRIVGRGFTDGQLMDMFAYHQPSPGMVRDMTELRELAYRYAWAIQSLVPDGPTKTLAIRALHGVSMQVNAAIVAGGRW